MKYIITLKSVIIDCIKKKWLKSDPFSEFSTAQKKVIVVPLYNDELKAIENKEITIDRLSLVKDIFIFSCYTGLAYIDVCNLRRSQIVSYMDGEKWIIATRQKTDAPQRIPILPQALKILEKYKNHPKCVDDDFALPILSNQKMNAYLKEIADICGVKKKLTFHIARHTFATTVTLANGVPIETVSSILGHSTIAQTQHYAKIVAMKLGQDMSNLKQKLSGN